jgi:hypothetical protein
MIRYLAIGMLLAGPAFAQDAETAANFPPGFFNQCLPQVLSDLDTQCATPGPTALSGSCRYLPLLKKVCEVAKKQTDMMGH